ncbi:MAG: hypothetical protein IJQ70_01435 [Synergistaceae bacterium]|nr:hypothetical protein [Synergistaceae bacterium]
MGRHILMICTSGTSAVTSLPSVKRLLDSPPPLTDEKIIEAVLNPEGSRDYADRLSGVELMKNPESFGDIIRDPKFGSSFKFPSAEVQTIMRWLSDTVQGKAPEVDELRIIMLPSEDPKSILTSEITTVCLNHLRPLFSEIKLICSRDSSAIIPLPIKVDSREEFLSSVSDLFSEFDKLIEGKRPDEEVIICSTGGYKAVSGFAMMYAQLHSLPCLYSFEGSQAAYEVMSIPLGYAYSSLDEEINMLKAVYKNTETDKSSLPQWVKDSEFMAGTLLKSYEKAREKPYGTGEELFRRLRKCEGGNEWADYIQELLTCKWSNLWLGDQIPETVEHSRRHSKRLMELAANLFRCAGNEIEKIGFTDKDPLPLALLIASIYLHDIGHTALSYPVAVRDADVNDENLFPLGLFPSAVRELHHLLTGEVLRSDPERYFMNEKYPANSEILSSCVPLIAAHHRGYTILKKNDPVRLKDDDKIMKAGNLILGPEKFSETMRPLEERAEGVNVPVDILLNVTALLRVLDGCDVQSDRVISRHYLEYRNQRSLDEARLIQAEMMSCIRQLPPELQREVKSIGNKEISESCKMIYSKVFDTLGELKEQYGTWRNVQGEALSEFMVLSLANRLAFKLEQHLHFQKHQCASFVFPVMNAERNMISVKIFPNEINDADISGTLKSIAKEIDGEYEKVANVLADFPVIKAEIVGAL